jgi:exosortase
VSETDAQSELRTHEKSSRLADLVVEEEVANTIPPLAWLKAAVIGMLICGFYYDELVNMSRKFLADSNTSHGFILPLFSLYMLYTWRHRLYSAERRVCLWGLGVVLLAVVIRAAGVLWIHNNWITQLTLPLLIWGTVLYLAGPRIAWIAIVPVALLVLGVPLPDRLYNMIALPLQNFAARMSAGLLTLFGANIQQTQSFLKVQSINDPTKWHPLQVAEACSGMRSLMAFVAMGLIVAYIEDRRPWQRVVLLLAGVPIAVVINVIRVTVTSAMFWIDQREFGEKFMHTAIGMILLIPGLLLLFLLGRVLNAVYVEEEVEDDDESSPEDSGEASAEAGS